MTAELMKELDEYDEMHGEGKTNGNMPNAIFINCNSTEQNLYNYITDEDDIKSKISHNENLSSITINATVKNDECTSSQNQRNMYACVFCGSRDHHTGQHNKETTTDHTTQSTNYTSDGSSMIPEKCTI